MHPLVAEVIPADGQMDRRAEAVVALRNLANAPKKTIRLSKQLCVNV